MAAPETPEGEGPGKPAGLGKALYKLALAGVGALTIAHDEIETRLRRLKDRGVEGDGAADAPPAEPTGAAPAADPPRAGLGEQVDATIGRVLDSLNLPSRAQLDRLSHRIDEVARRLDELSGPR